MTVIRRRTDPSINDQQDAAAGTLIFNCTQKTAARLQPADLTEATSRFGSTAADQRQRLVARRPLPQPTRENDDPTDPNQRQEIR